MFKFIKKHRDRRLREKVAFALLRNPNYDPCNIRIYIVNIVGYINHGEKFKSI